MSWLIKSKTSIDVISLPDFKTMKSVTFDKNGNMTSIEFRSVEEIEALEKLFPTPKEGYTINIDSVSKTRWA